MDFDDLLILTVKLLKDDEGLRQLYQRKFRHVLVDEYQDTNCVQCDLIDLLVGEKQYLMVVGDDAQSIYSWRGADMDNILSFQDKYRDAQIFKIETNYRSVPEVLELSNAAIRPNRARFDMTLNANCAQVMLRNANGTTNAPIALCLYFISMAIKIRIIVQAKKITDSYRLESGACPTPPGS